MDPESVESAPVRTTRTGYQLSQHGGIVDPAGPGIVESAPSEPRGPGGLLTLSTGISRTTRTGYQLSQHGGIVDPAGPGIVESAPSEPRGPVYR